MGNKSNPLSRERKEIMRSGFGKVGDRETWSESEGGQKRGGTKVASPVGKPGTESGLLRRENKFLLLETL